MLGWDDTDFQSVGGAGAVQGKLLWIKPTVMQNDPVDVRQYKLENPAFPQQTTADQFFDEAQFESYRALGYHIVKQRLDDVEAKKGPLPPTDPEALFL
jgi:hypothetical protein